MGHELMIESPFRWTNLTHADLKSMLFIDYTTFLPGGVSFFQPGEVEEEWVELMATGQDHITIDFIWESPGDKSTINEMKRQKRHKTNILICDQNVVRMYPGGPVVEKTT